MSRPRVAAGTVGLLAMWAVAAAGQVDVDQVMKDFGISADAAVSVRNGEMVESEPRESSDRELAVGLTFVVRQPIANLRDEPRGNVWLRRHHRAGAREMRNRPACRGLQPPCAIGWLCLSAAALPWWIVISTSATGTIHRRRSLDCSQSPRGRWSFTGAGSPRIRLPALDRP
jgi:hypothetical protein